MWDARSPSERQAFSLHDGRRADRHQQHRYPLGNSVRVSYDPEEWKYGVALSTDVMHRLTVEFDGVLLTVLAASIWLLRCSRSTIFRSESGIEVRFRSIRTRPPVAASTKR